MTSWSSQPLPSGSLNDASAKYERPGTDSEPGMAARRRPLTGPVCVGAFVLSRPLVAAGRRDGLGVATGTVNDAALLSRVAAFGVDAVTTDDPAALRARLALATQDARVKVAMIRGCPSTTTVASTRASVRPASWAIAASPPAPKPQ